MYCRNCNSPLAEGSAFCPACGHPRSGSDSTTNTQPIYTPPVASPVAPATAEKKKISPKMRVVIGIVIAAALVGLFFLLYPFEGSGLPGTKWITRDGEIIEFKKDYNGVMIEEYDWAYGGDQDKQFFSYSIRGNKLIIYAESSRYYDDGISRRYEYEYDIINDELILSMDGKAIKCYNYYKSFICDDCHGAAPNKEKHTEQSLGEKLTLCEDCWEDFNEFYEEYGMTRDEYYAEFYNDY